MDDSAAILSASRREAPHPHVVRVLAGEFTAGAEYETWRAEGTSDWLLIYTVAGSGSISANPGSRVETVAGDAVLIRPRTRHDYATSGSTWSLAFAHFHPRAEWAALLEWPAATDGVAVVHAPAWLRGRILSALRAASRSNDSAFDRAEMFAVNALESALLWLDTQNRASGGMDERVGRVVEHVATHLGAHHDLAALAAVAHLSPSRLTHLFTAELGMSPQRYVEHERLTRAAQLLVSTTRSIGDIAHDVGWSDPLYFSRRFRHVHGVSPTGYRTRVGEIPR